MGDLIVLPKGLPVAPNFGAASTLALAFLPQTEIGNALRFIAEFGSVFRFVDGWGWVHFDGKSWNTDHTDHAAFRAACALPEMIKSQASAVEVATNVQFLAAASAASRDGCETYDAQSVTSSEYARQLRRWARSSGNVPVIRGMLRVAQSLLLTPREEFDQDPLALNVQNGTLRFVVDGEGPAQVRLDPHNASDLITKISPFPYDEKAACDVWERHLCKMLPEADVRDYVQRIGGYCATGLQSEQAFFVFQGRGGDGKSTTVNVIRRVLGEYAATSDIKSFVVGERHSAEAASPQMARLSGDIRLVSVAEPARNAQLNEERIKAATGGAPMVARHLHGKPFEYAVRWKLVCEVNWLPEVQGTDDGIWRRAHLVQWPVQLRRDEMVGGLETRIVEGEGAGVLAWIVRGICSYLDEGLNPPDVAMRAVRAWRDSGDQVGEWLGARVDTTDSTAVVDQIALWEDYQDFCDANGMEARSSRWFAKELENRGIVKLPARDSRSRRVQRRGARLVESVAVSDIPSQATEMTALPDEPCPF